MPKYLQGVRGTNRGAVLSMMAASALAFSGLTGLAATANAADVANVVTFGDSYLSNPTPAETIGAKARKAAEEAGIPLDSPAGNVLTQYTPHGCGQSSTNTPRQIGAKTGLEVRDYSCPGAVAYVGGNPDVTTTLAKEIDNALGDRALDSQTRNVVIQFGFNDSYNHLMGKVLSNGIADTYNNLQAAYDEQRGFWMNSMNNAINRIKAAAPQARITIADYPTISEPTSGNQCLLHVPVLPGNLGIPAFWIRDAEVNIHNWSGELAAARANENVVFANVGGATLGNGQCAPDGQREIAGLIDTTAISGYNLPVHMTNNGVTRMADIIVATM